MLALLTFTHRTTVVIVVLLLVACAPKAPTNRYRPEAQASSGVAAKPPSAREQSSHPATPLEPEEWLRARALRLDTLEPDARNFDNLAKLSTALKDVQVVMLGEETHGDGTTFRAKVRLVEFLHEELGFDVIVFESDMFSCREAWRRLVNRSEPPRRAAEECIYPLWTSPRQTEPLWTYMGRAVGTAHPLELWGMDSSPGGTYARSSLIPYLRDAFRKCSKDSARISSAIDTVARLVQAGYSFHAESAELGKLAVLTRHANSSCVSDAIGTAEASFLAQLCRSIMADAKWRDATNGQKELSTSERMNDRDAQMARNFLWLLKNRFRGRKVIVWAASLHVAKDLSAVDTRVDYFNYSGYKPFGQWVSEALGLRAYSVGFLAAEGSWGGHMRNRPPVELSKPDPNSLEGLMSSAGLENAIVELRGAEAHDWRSARLLAGPFGYMPMAATWPDVFDAIVFTRHMAPSRWMDN